MERIGSNAVGVALLAGTASFFVSRAAEACGVSATGVASCSLAEHREAGRDHWAVGVGFVYTSTVLRFDDSLRAEQERYALLAEAAYLPTPTLALSVAAGAALGGKLETPNGEYSFLPGPAFALGARWSVVEQPSYFLGLTGMLSFEAARTRRDGESSAYQAFDLRLGGDLGLVLARVLRPYVLARVFGGPVFWTYGGENVVGGDIYHYQFGLGLRASLNRSVHLSLEFVPLGEVAASAGASVSF